LLISGFCRIFLGSRVSSPWPEYGAAAASGKEPIWFWRQLSRHCIGGPQPLQRIRQMPLDPAADGGLMAVIIQSERDDADADQRQREREQHRILEHLVGEIAEIERDADGAEHRKDAAAQKCREQQE